MSIWQDDEFKKHVFTEIIDNEVQGFCSFYEVVNNSALTLIRDKKGEIQTRDQYNVNRTIQDLLPVIHKEMHRSEYLQFRAMMLVQSYN